MKTMDFSKLKYGLIGFATAGALAFSGQKLLPFQGQESLAAALSLGRPSTSSTGTVPAATLPTQAAAPGLGQVSVGAADPNIYVALSRQVVPSVVNIQTLSAPRRPQYPQGQGSPDEFFQFFFGGQPQGRRTKFPPRNPDASPRPMSLGTGFVIDSSGLILTNNHVIDGADEIRIAFTEDPSEKPVKAEVVGVDPDLDTALLRVKTDRDLNAIPLGDSEALQVGEYVMAVGNPFGQGHSVTHGIISAKGRLSPDFPLANYLQTDAPINPGNSGGPLLNLKGEVIGINNAIDARAQGIGFAIPINSVKSILSQLKDGKVSRGYLCVQVTPLDEELARNLGLPKDLQAPMVAQADPGEPAFRAGLRPYDVILEVNGKKVATPSDLIAAVAATPSGDSVNVKVNRGGEERSFKVKLGSRPSAVARR